MKNSTKYIFIFLFTFYVSLTFGQASYVIVTSDSKWNNVLEAGVSIGHTFSFIGSGTGCNITGESSRFPGVVATLSSELTFGTLSVNWNNANIGTVTFRVTGCTGTPSANATYTKSYPILNIPDDIAGSTEVSCGIQNVTYSVPPVANANSYEWTYPSGWSASGSATSNSITLQTNANGVGSINVKAVNGNLRTSSNTIDITRPQFTTPTISNYGDLQGIYGLAYFERVLCGTTNVEVSGGNATSYDWQTTGGVSVNSTSSIASISASSDGSIRVYPVSACGSAVGTDNYALVNIFVGSPGTPAFTADGDGNSFVNMCAGNSKYLVANSDRAASFDFQLLNGNASLITQGTNSAVFNTYDTGTFRVQAFANNCSGSGSNTKYINVIDCYSSYRIGPNPATDNLSIAYNKDTPTDLMPDNIKLLNSKMKEYYSKDVKNKIKNKEMSGYVIDMDVSKFPRGEYYLHITNSNHPEKDKKLEKLKVILQ
jgi:PKD-like domain